MYLYELALELDLRSPDLITRAELLGLTGLGPSSKLSAAEVASIRSGVPVPPPAPVAITAAPSTPPSGGGMGPVSWAPVGVPSTAPSAPAAPRRSSLPPPPGRGPAVGASVPGAPLPPLVPPVAAEPTSTEPDGPSHRNQWIAAGVLAPLIVVLFAFMAVNSGPDREREAALRGEKTGDVDERRSTPQADIVGGIGAAPIEAAPDGAAPAAEPAPTTTAVPVASSCPEVPPAAHRPLLGRPGVGDCAASVPKDLDAFCDGGLRVLTFERALIVAGPGGAARVRNAIVTGRNRWKVDAALMADSAPPELAADITNYRTWYTMLLAPVTIDTTEAELVDILGAHHDDGLIQSGDRINAAIDRLC